MSMPNGTQALVTGYLDTNHTSSIEAYWINRPTPWPFVAASVTLSIILGFLGVQASYKSWESSKKTRSGSSVISMNDISYQPVRQSSSSYEQHHRRWHSASSSNDFSTRSLIEHDAMDTFFNDQRRSSTSIYTAKSGRSMHGGLGRFALITTAVGITWSTIRAALTLALMIQIVRGEKHTYPGIASLVIMFTSVQTYLGSRAMPRILYLLIVVDLLVIYGCVVLAMFSFLQDRKTSYQEFAIRGGTCPCMLGFKTGHDMQTCATFPSPPAFVGCDEQYLWTNNIDTSSNLTATYPKSCLLSSNNDSDRDLNPNLMTYLVLAEIIVGGIGLLYGLIVLAFASRWIPRALAEPRQLFVTFALTPAHSQPGSRRPGPNPIDPFAPVARDRNQKMPARAVGMTVLAFVAMLAFAAVTIVVHVLDETRPIRLFYRDGAGALLAGAGSIGGNNVVDAGGGDLVLGASWTDCFVVDIPYWADGGFDVWWRLHRSNWLRAVALV